MRVRKWSIQQCGECAHFHEAYEISTIFGETIYLCRDCTLKFVDFLKKFVEHDKCQTRQN